MVKIGVHIAFRWFNVGNWILVVNGVPIISDIQIINLIIISNGFNDMYMLL